MHTIPSRLAATAVAAVLLHAGPVSAQPDDAGEPAAGQVLVVPFTAPPPLAARAQQFTLIMSDAVGASGAESVSAQATGSDIALLTGCESEDTECYETVATVIGVDQVVVGTLEPVESPYGDLAVSMTLVAPNREPRRRRIVLDSGASNLDAQFREQADAFLAGRPAPQPSAPAAVEPAPAEEGGFRFGQVKAYSWGVAGGGVALVGLGALLLIAADGKQDEVDRAPTATVADLERLADLEASGRSYTRWGNVTLIGGGVLALIGAALVIKQGRGGERRSVTVAPAPVAGELGLGLGLTVRGDL